MPNPLNQTGSHTAVPFLVATAGIATFACMDVLMKGLSIELGAYNAMLWRTSIAVTIAATLFFIRREPWPAMATLRVHLWRGLVVSLMAFLFFWGLAYVPLAEAIALSFIAPLIALYLAAVMLKEAIGRKAVMASVVGFTGALVIIGGSLGGEYNDDIVLGIIAILVSAMMYAYNLILQRRQALIAGPIEIAFFQSGTVVFVYLCFSPWWAVPPPMAQIPQLCGAAILGIASVLLLSWAYARAQANILIPVEYTAFVWAALLGWLVFGESVTVATLAGATLIVTGCLVALRQQPERVVHVETTAI
jgi:S-adenosylmethionine uptake transporter